MAADSSFVWLRPATVMEEHMDCAHRKVHYTTVNGMTVRSSVPLSNNHIKETLHHLFRKVPSLRMCFRKRGDTLWACDINREQIDFQVMETQELVPAVEALLQHRFHTTEGPLWCARLLPVGAPGRCPRADVAAAFPYSRTLLLANHHGIADGTTNMFVMNAFLRVLDDVVAGKPVDDAAQLGELVVGEETEALVTAKMQEQDRLHQRRKDIEKAKLREKLIPRAYPMARDPDYKSQIVLRDLDVETTQSFFSKCKKERVTVNSAIAALLNVSLVDFVRESGLEQDFYLIRGMHPVNLRRYWPGDTSRTLGVHMAPMENISSTPAKWRDNFWDYARSMHGTISQGLQDKDPLMHLALMKLRGSTEDFFSERPPPEADYGTGNTGNIDPLIPTEGQYVRITHIFGVTSCWHVPIYHLFHTLRGSFMYSLSYTSDVLTRANAQHLVDKIFDNVMAVTGEMKSKL